MTHFAKVENGVVTAVIVADQEFIDSGAVGDPTHWVQTSYNTREGVYYTPNTAAPDPDQTKAFRKNFAGIGFTYDVTRDAFIPPKPFPSWALDEFSCVWKPPMPQPTSHEPIALAWDEALQQWVVVQPPQDEV